MSYSWAVCLKRKWAGGDLYVTNEWTLQCRQCEKVEQKRKYAHQRARNQPQVISRSMHFKLGNRSGRCFRNVNMYIDRGARVWKYVEKSMRRRNQRKAIFLSTHNPCIPPRFFCCCCCIRWPMSFFCSGVYSCRRHKMKTWRALAGKIMHTCTRYTA